MEWFGRTSFPAIGDLTYLLTLGRHGFFWLSIEPPKTTAAADRSEYEIPRIEMNASFDGILRGESRKQLERLLPSYLLHCRWFRAKTLRMTGVHIAETMPITQGPNVPHLTRLNVEYSNAEPE